MGVGNRIVSDPPRVDEQAVELFRSVEVATANVADVMGRFGTLRGLHRHGGTGRYLAGPAITVRTRPTDNLLVHAALDLARPGDVVVVDAGGGRERAIVGALMARYALRRGIAGLVIDGMVRDADELSELGLPVYARGVVPDGPYKDGPGEINVPISCGGTAVLPGDLVLGDGDGVVLVPGEAAAEVGREAAAVQAREQRIVQDIADDAWDRAWVGRALEREARANV